jgi:hypothetical protein
MDLVLAQACHFASRALKEEVKEIRAQLSFLSIDLTVLVAYRPIEYELSAALTDTEMLAV